jgi:uncharacterized protein
MDLELANAVFLGGLVSGFSGFVFSTAAGAILLTSCRLCRPPDDDLSIKTQATSVFLVRKLVVWTDVIPLMLGGVVSLPIALFLLTRIEAGTIRVAFGLFLLSYAVTMLWRPALVVARTIGGPAANFVVGFGGGLMGGLTAMPAALPVIWCNLRGIPKEPQRTMVQPFTLLIQLIAVPLLWWLSVDTINRIPMVDVALSILALTTGTLFGMALFGRVDDRKFRVAVLVLLFVSGCLMVR